MKIPEQIHAGLIDGAVVLSGTGTEDFRRGAYGIADRMKQAPMQFDSVFDIASLTKVTGTAVLLAFCVEEGIIDLDAPFTEYLPYHGRLFSPVTVRQLATHYSGIQINYPYFPGEEKKMIEAILSLDFVRPPMTEYEYTCTNYILLGLLIERVMKKPLEQLAEERIFRPLGMNDTKWGAPVDGALSRTIRTINAAPGVISDHGARAIAPHRIGNAGIFSTASDLAKFCRMMLNRGRGFFKTDIAELFFTNQAPPGMTPPKPRRSWANSSFILPCIWSTTASAPCWPAVTATTPASGPSWTTPCTVSAKAPSPRALPAVWTANAVFRAMMLR